MIKWIRVFAIAAGAATAASAAVLSSADGFQPTSVTSGTRSWAGTEAANGVAGSNVTAYNTKSFDITEAIGGKAVQDWVILTSDNAVYTRKAGGLTIGAVSDVDNTTDYSGYTEITPADGAEGTADRLTWTGGDPVASGTDVAGLNSKRSYNGNSGSTGIEGSGFTFSLPASTEPERFS